MKRAAFILLAFLRGSFLFAQDSLSQQDFLMPIEDVFSISGRGTVVTGKIERGIVRSGDLVEIVGLSESSIKSKVISIETFAQQLTEAKAGDNIGLLLSGVNSNDIKRGMVVCKPGSVKVFSVFKCDLKLATKEEGGRSTPVFNKYRPQFVFYTATVSGEVTLPSRIERMLPGDNVTVTVTLTDPAAMINGMQVSVKEGGRMVGKGKVVETIQ